MYPKVGLVGLPSSILPCGGVCHMKRLRLAVSVFLFVSALVILGCSISNNPPFQATGTLTTIQTGDAVNDQILKFELTISSITLTGVSPTATTGNLLAKPSEIEFVHEAGTLEPLTVAHVPAGTYNGATLSVSNPEVVVVIGTTPTKVPATLSSPTVNVTFANITVGTTPLFINFRSEEHTSELQSRLHLVCRLLLEKKKKIKLKTKSELKRKKTENLTALTP